MYSGLNAGFGLINELFECLLSGLENREHGHRDVTLTTWHPVAAKAGTNFIDKQWLLGVRSQTKTMEFSFFILHNSCQVCNHIKYENYQVLETSFMTYGILHYSLKH
jgi:hypothetical protein